MDRTEIHRKTIRLELEVDSACTIDLVDTARADGLQSLVISEGRNIKEFLVSRKFGLSVVDIGPGIREPSEDLARDSELGEVLGRGKGLRLDLVPNAAITSVAKVLGWSGSGKYKDWDWVTRYTPTECWAAAMRHLVKWGAGDPMDEESPFSHIDHAITRLVMMRHIMDKKEGTEGPPKAGSHGE